MPPDSPNVQDAFLCHHGRDRAAVEWVGNWLKQIAKLSIVIDHGNLDPGDPIDHEIETALESSRCVVIFLGPHSLGRWQTEEAHAFLDTTVRDANLRIIPVLLPGLTAEARQDFPISFQRKLWVQFSRDTHELPALHALAQAIRRARSIAESIPEAPPARLADQDSPYRGLAPFLPEHHPFFCGRDVLVQQILLRLEGRRFLAVTGPTYCGKTSVVAAGVIPELEAQGWLCRILIPTPNPLAQLAASLHALQGENRRWSLDELTDNLREAGVPILGVLADQILDDRGRQHLLLVIDSFDTLLARADDDPDRTRFVQLLVAAVRAHDARIRIILTFRSEALGRCAADRDLNDLVTRHLAQVGTMSTADLRDAIAGPARLKGLGLEPGLIDRILEDLPGDPDKLALLSHALAELFRRRELRNGRETLTLDAYGAIGGVPASIGHLADEEFQRVHERLGPEAGRLLRQLLLFHLVELETSPRGAPRTVPVAEISKIPADFALLQQVIEAWMEAGLLVGVPDPEGSETSQGGAAATVDAPTIRDARALRLSHDLLVRRWPRLQAWLTEQRDDARSVGALRSESRSWREQGRLPATLLSGSRLFDAEELAARIGTELPSDLNEFIAASVQARDQTGRGVEASLRQELHAARELAAASEAALREAVANAAAANQARAGAEAQTQEMATARDLALARARERTAGLVVAVLLGIAVGVSIGWLLFQ